MLNPNFTLLYVDQPLRSAAFYGDLLGCAPVESGPTFAMFVLPTGLKLGLWSKHTVEPAFEAAKGGPGGGAELVFTVDSAEAVEAAHAAWKAKGLPILQAPVAMDFGRTFVALDPDGHRLRVYFPEENA
ncbi:drug:proton antiporter [Geothrix limicola]|uniref:Drug:proton antiporter n=1 Tax=Geothrix limicola TaxID=2927978 RepID=A0ABQ5QFB0_9BACT|nr:VOC family protein [Geothrix limicola]GLH73373.1 drug:proton antiporter [Geothrix limicola]